MGLILCCLPIAALPPGKDWLVTPVRAAVRATPSPNGNQLTLANGLISRTFTLAPNFATVDLTNLITGASLLRGVKPEATLWLDGQRYEIGGLKGQPDYAYLDPEWLPAMTSSPEAFQFAGYETGRPIARYPWTPHRHSANTPWPPRGLALTAHFRPPDAVLQRYQGLVVSIHYEMYQGLPVICKWVSVENGTKRTVTVDSLECEVLAVNEQERHRLHVESDYAFAGMNTTVWGPDPEYTSQIDYEYQLPVLLTSKAPLGPAARVEPGGTFESFRTFELLQDSDDRERRGMARRRMYRTLAPQVTENPIFMHARSSDSASVRLAIDQCADVGFEMVILTFWSGFDIETQDPAAIARFKADVEYAHSKGIELGGYTLMCASRDVGPGSDCISPQTGKPGSKFGQSACLATKWADGYFTRVLSFMDATGMDVIETDGPYHGDVCASTTHAHHAGLADSQWAQWRACVGFYHECLRRGIYINTPDWYYLSGSNKCGMGYRETNFSLPRWRQILIARQNIYDGTFEKTPSMGWMFVPLVEYHGGGAEATLEPLSQHLAEYEWHLAQNFGSGVMAAYRGPRLYDTEATKAVVRKWVAFYKAHRSILDADIVHVRRPDGRGIDCMMHVSSQGKERALAMVYNPTNAPVKTKLRLPLYYTGLTSTAAVRHEGGRAVRYTLDREYGITVPISMGPRSITWYVVEP
jgi:hypothetical protein